jgi:hypothetical protein
MAWQVPTAPAASGLFANRRQAQPALLRMFARARRAQTPLLLVRLSLASDGGAAEAEARPRPWEASVGELRLTDLAWAESREEMMLLLENAGEEDGLRRRLEQRAGGAGARLHWRGARFPEQGLTLEALLEAVAWRR